MTKKADTMVVYKALRDGISPVQHFTWPLPEGDKPGDWVEILPTEKPKLCAKGLHGYLTRKRAENEGNQVFEMEIEGDIEKDNDKATGRRGRLVRQLSGRFAATLGDVATAVASSPAQDGTALLAAATKLGVKPLSIENAIPADIFVVDEMEALVTLRRYLSRKVSDLETPNAIAVRVQAIAAMPLSLEAAR